MKKVGLFWGSDTGNTQTVASLIAEAFGGENIVLHDIGQSSPEDLLQYEFLILGIPTWGIGELQSDWDNFFPKLDKIDFSGVTVALFGLGDQYTYSGYFLDAMGLLYEKIVEQGANVVGSWPADGYEFDESKAVVDGAFVGLAIDQDNQEELTQDRVTVWAGQIKELFAEIAAAEA
ncbi:flavodoxin [Chloroherpeton thalassium ATCC 35110]|uniref:Flavodoxin n=1 Tax=Chloroherpeton thalassium (strain ATCC 35110 / GB-78) TaxID=517418 RepID=B3QXC6_CHLT3|nr:flavodoxin [Chloroherpeton thalassium]ACF13400.1 flavodoxin [Chloroherpeton thalassium ATCC 35110]